jgi:hypothetical protein
LVGSAGVGVPEGIPVDETEHHMGPRSGAELRGATQPEIRTARVYDTVDPSTGPAFHPDHPRVDDPAERAALLAYLRTGAVLVYSTELRDDVLEPARRGVVPASLRTDGIWVWAETVAYYLEHHHLAPDPLLVEHIRTLGFHKPELTEEAAYRVLAATRRGASAQW